MFADLVAATLDATGALAFTEVTARLVIDMGCALTPASRPRGPRGSSGGFRV